MNFFFKFDSITVSFSYFSVPQAYMLNTVPMCAPAETCFILFRIKIFQNFVQNFKIYRVCELYCQEKCV